MASSVHWEALASSTPNPERFLSTYFLLESHSHTLWALGSGSAQCPPACPPLPGLSKLSP